LKDQNGTLKTNDLQPNQISESETVFPDASRTGDISASSPSFAASRTVRLAHVADNTAKTVSPTD